MTTTETTSTPFDLPNTEIRKLAKKASAELRKLEATLAEAEADASEKRRAFERDPDEQKALSDRVAQQRHTNAVAALEAARERHAELLDAASHVAMADRYEERTETLRNLNAEIDERVTAIADLEAQLRTLVGELDDLTTQQTAAAREQTHLGERCRKLRGPRVVIRPLSLDDARELVWLEINRRNQGGTVSAPPPVGNWLAITGGRYAA